MDKSNKIIKGLAMGTALAVGASVPAYSQNMPEYTPMPIIYDDNTENYESLSRLDFYRYLSDVDMSEYDVDFVNLYRNGTIIIGENTYKIDDLFKEVEYENNEKKIILISCHNSDIDLLTGYKKYNYIRENIFLLKKTQVFYDIYSLYKNNLYNNSFDLSKCDLGEIVEYINNCDGTIHNKTPELNYHKNKVKIK